MLNMSRAVGAVGAMGAMPLYGLAHSATVYQFAPKVAPKFLPNATRGRNREGFERGLGGWRGGGGLLQLLLLRSHTTVLICQKGHLESRSW